MNPEEIRLKIAEERLKPYKNEPAHGYEDRQTPTAGYQLPLDTSQAPSHDDQAPSHTAQPAYKNPQAAHNASENNNPQVIFAWKAPLRAYKKQTAGVMRFYVALALLLSLIVFFLGEKILVLPIWATLFLVYMMTTTPPPIIDNKITKFGIITAGTSFRWENLSHFYFIKRFDYQQVIIVSQPPYYLRIYLVIKNEDKNDVLNLLSEHLIYQETPVKMFADRLTEWLTKLMPDTDYVAAEPKTPQNAPSEPVVQPL